MLFTITATVTRHTDVSIVRQVPTFFLDQDVQGIVSREQLGRIVSDILNPFKLDDVKVSWNCQPDNFCTCGNLELGFDCVCDWIKQHPGTTIYICEFCGCYGASDPRCNKCQPR